LPITYLQNGTIYEEYPDGSKKKNKIGIQKKSSKKRWANIKKGNGFTCKKISECGYLPVRTDQVKAHYLVNSKKITTRDILLMLMNWKSYCTPVD